MKGTFKKGQIGSLSILPVVAITFVIAAVVFGVGFEFIDDTIESLPNPCPSTHNIYNHTDRSCWNSSSGVAVKVVPTSAAFNGTSDTESGMSKVSNKAPTIGLAIAAGIIIAVIVGFLAIRLR